MVGRTGVSATSLPQGLPTPRAAASPQPADLPGGRLPLRLRLSRRRARRVLTIERLWRALRLPLVLLLAWGLLGLVRLPQSLPDLLHSILEGTLLFGVFYLAYRRLHACQPLTEREIDQRIEHDSALANQPLSTLTDQAATSGPVPGATQRAIWAQHRARTLLALRNLKVRGPYLFPDWGSRLGLLACLLLVTGGVFHAAPHTFSRLRAALLPGTDDDTVPLPHVQAWIDLPGWARGAPIFLSESGGPKAPLPQGARLHVVVSGSTGWPILRGTGAPTLRALSPTSWEATAPLMRSGTVTLTVRGRQLARWPLKVLPDLPPQVTWTARPKAEGWRTAFAWQAAQPSGLKSVTVVLSWPPGRAHPRQVSRLSLPFKGHPQTEKTVSVIDTSENILAGLKVEGRLEATSLSGQTAVSAPVVFRLGSRSFSDPLARALIETRQRLGLRDETLHEAEQDLSLLAALPLPASLQLPLATLLVHLQTTRRKDGSLQPILADLWYLALYAEDRATLGPQMAALMARLRAEQRAAELALRSMAGHQPVPLDQQTALHEDLAGMETALDHRMALMRQLAGQNGLLIPMPQGKGTPWHRLAGKIQTEALDGQTEAALMHLAEMSEMAEQMRQAGTPDLQELARQMQARAEARLQRRALQDLIRRETALLNHGQARLAVVQHKNDVVAQSRDISQMSTAELLRQLGMQPPAELEAQAPAPEVTLDPATEQQQAQQRQEDHATQKALQTLDRILENRGKTLTGKQTQGLLKADQDMQTALQALARRDDPQAVSAEEKVLQDLSQARNQMRQNQKAAQGKSQGRLGFIPPQGQARPQSQDQGGQGEEQDPDEDGQDPDDDSDTPASQANRDPLGRKLDNSPESDAHIPDRHDDAAQAIEKELRRRASDRTRPQSELDYLNRLLAPFRAQSGTGAGSDTTDSQP
ncbi:DUF4175 family protein [Oecophyllibacter saccharovorans]|nr:DUF4175 family protein [Oecophyllibacter saccharovorans]